MKDLIDRQAAVDFIDVGHLCNPNEPRWSDNEVVNFLRSRPSAQGYADTAYLEKMSELTFDTAFRMGKASVQQWIPVTERLPQEDGRYLTTNGQGWYEVASYAHQYSDIDAMYELPQEGGGWYIYDSEWGYCVYSSVVAWMPIEPWKGEKVE